MYWISCCPHGEQILPKSYHKSSITNERIPDKLRIVSIKSQGVGRLRKATLLRLSCLPFYINIQSHLTVCKIHKHSQNKNNGTLKTCTTTDLIRADSNWCYRLYNWTYWVHLYDRYNVVPSAKRTRFSEHAHSASHGRLVYRKSQGMKQRLRGEKLPSNRLAYDTARFTTSLTEHYLSRGSLFQRTEHLNDSA